MMPHVLADSATMVRRQVQHMRRAPSLTLQVMALPVVFLLLFVYVLGGTLGNGLTAGAGGRAEYVTYVVPGILLMAVAAVATGTAVSVSLDMTTGIVTRFKTMAIGRVSVLTGHVVGALVQTFLAVAVVVAVALAVGFRPAAGVLEWLATAGVVGLVTFALTWLSVALGLAAKSVDSASNLPMPLTILPFLGSGVVPAESMPAGLRWFAEHQPFTPIIETLRGLLLGTGTGGSGGAAVAWSAGLALAGYLWARRLYNR